jgi:hypothetical protein
VVKNSEIDNNRSGWAAPMRDQGRALDRAHDNENVAMSIQGCEPGVMCLSNRCLRSWRPKYRDRARPRCTGLESLGDVGARSSPVHGDVRGGPCRRVLPTWLTPLIRSARAST